LNISDIEGTNVDTYKKYKHLEGRDYLKVDDIDRTRPKQLKQNRITNIPDYRNNSTDIAQNVPQKNKFVTHRNVDPLNPVYKVETQSRRHTFEVGKIEGSAPKAQKSPATRRHTNDVTDIKGSQPLYRGSMPANLRSSVSKPNLPPIAEYTRNPSQQKIVTGAYNT